MYDVRIEGRDKPLATYPTLDLALTRARAFLEWYPSSRVCVTGAQLPAQTLGRVPIRYFWALQCLQSWSYAFGWLDWYAREIKAGNFQTLALRYATEARDSAIREHCAHGRTSEHD